MNIYIVNCTKVIKSELSREEIQTRYNTKDIKKVTKSMEAQIGLSEYAKIPTIKKLDDEAMLQIRKDCLKSDKKVNDFVDDLEDLMIYSAEELDEIANYLDNSIM